MPAKKKEPASPEKKKAPVRSRKKKLDDRFPIVGIGASAGGLEAFEQLFQNMPPDTGMAFVLVPHLDPTHKSIMTELIRRYTKMPVYEVKDKMVPAPNSIYVIPPNSDLAYEDEKLRLIVPEEARGLRHPIDYFFRSLAGELKERSVCIILSGTGSEGTLGLKAIKEEGGLVMVQDPATAKYVGMPDSAISTGLVDFVLPPDKIPGQLVSYVKNILARGPVEAGVLAEPPTYALSRILSIVKKQTGHDFSRYKQGTITRRVQRRMSVNQIGRVTEYERRLKEDPAEIDLLAKEFLIGVTNFFRDRDAFEALRQDVILPMVESAPGDHSLRVWVPGCSTGEEAYSVAILLKECMEKTKRHLDVQIFATDLDEAAVDKARMATYPDTIDVDVSSDRLKKYFVRQDSKYQVRKEVREMVVFAIHDLIKDPPFSRIDLVCCRNLLIYMSQDLQKTVLPLFYYSLVPGGYLFLGASETVGEFTDLFSIVDKRNRIYQRRKAGRERGGRIEYPAYEAMIEAGERQRIRESTRKKGLHLRDVTEKLLLSSYAPPSVVVNEQGDIVYVYGKVGAYLQPASGEPTQNILKMAREELRFELGAALHRAFTQNKKVMYERMRVDSEGGQIVFNLSIAPLPGGAPMKGLLLVVFDELYVQPRVEAEEKPAVKRKKAMTEKDMARRIEELDRELKATREYLQGTIEELQSANEELQSTNEELQTSKEELQSVNEELMTVNSELQGNMAELARVNSEMSNLLSSTGIATIFLDQDLRIKRYTPATKNLINLLDTDIGRPLSDIVTNLRYPDMQREMRTVLDTLEPREKVVEHEKGSWYHVRILPYRTLENVIEGLVISFIEITSEKTTQERLEDALQYAQGIVDTVHEPLVALDKNLKAITANEAFYRTFACTRDDTLGRPVFELCEGLWDIPELREMLGRILPENSELNDYLVEHDFPGIGRKKMILNARRIHQQGRKTETILLAIEDITGREDA